MIFDAASTYKPYRDGICLSWHSSQLGMRLRIAVIAGPVVLEPQQDTY